MVGISPNSERTRLIILCLLDLLAGIPLVLFLWYRQDIVFSKVSLGGFVLYFLYQVVSGLAQLEGTSTMIALVGGSVYLGLGLAGYYFAKSYEKPSTQAEMDQ